MTHITHPSGIAILANITEHNYSLPWAVLRIASFTSFPVDGIAWRTSGRLVYMYIIWLAYYASTHRRMRLINWVA